MFLFSSSEVVPVFRCLLNIAMAVPAAEAVTICVVSGTLT
jgi:hypothetical protein